MKKWNPDGFFISNGPGDPASMDYAVETVKEILKNDQCFWYLSGTSNSSKSM